jgi:hypothetical protein
MEGAADEHTQVQETTGKALKRRGILAAAAAVVAGFVAKQASMPVEAATGGSQGTALILGANYANGTSNTSTQTTMIFHNGASIGSYYFADAFVAVASDGGTGVQGKSSSTGIGVYGTVYPDTSNARGVLGSVGVGTGVSGVAATGTGVYGESAGNSVSKGIYGKHTASGYAVYGEAISSGGYGVTGVALNQFGVIGQSDSGTAVQGQVQATMIGGGANTAANTAAVKGLNQSSGAGGFGVYGTTAHGFAGVYGLAGAAQGTGGVVGVATQAGTIGFAGVAYAPATDAGYFTGNVSVFGNFGVSGGKFAVVKGGDGTYRGMYAVESPECWFEDFGTGTLAGGTATVKLDPLFAQHVHTDDYHVFITEHDQHNDLNVANRTATAFTVQADDATLNAKGKSAAAVHGTFSYRIVARRNDIKGERLPVWEMPTPAFTKPEPIPAPLPKRP